MTRTIEVVFGDPDGALPTVSLHYRPLTTPIAGRYLAALEQAVREGYPLRDRDRFYNFPGSPQDLPWIADRINACIDTIHAWAPGSFSERAWAGMPQSQLNRLHHDFERHRGGILSPGELFTRAPPDIRRALEDYNLLIHRYEDRQREESRPRPVHPNAVAILTFEDVRPRYPLLEEDYRHFSQRAVFGDLMINYCEVGKPIRDFLHDDDDVIGADNIRPLRYYSADALLRFGPSTPLWRHAAGRLRDRARWWGPRGRYLRGLGFRPGDPRNAIGNIPVATLIRDRGEVAGRSEVEIVELLSSRPWFHGVRVLGD